MFGAIKCDTVRAYRLNLNRSVGPFQARGMLTPQLATPLRFCDQLGYRRHKLDQVLLNSTCAT